MNRNLVVLISALLFFTSCSSEKLGGISASAPSALPSITSPSLKNFSTVASENFDKFNKLLLEKMPKDARTVIGLPMHSFYNKDKSVYQMAYPLTREGLTCYWFNFERNAKGEYIYQPSNFGMETSCTYNADDVIYN